MNIRKLIDRYVKNECTPEELEYLARYLKKSPYELDEFFEEEEWENFEYDEKLHPLVSERLLEGINRKKAKSIAVYRTLRKSMAAAAVILIVVSAVLFFNKNTVLEENQIAESKISNPASRLVTKVNNSNEKKWIRMEDNSLVELFPESEIKYYEPFVMNGKRRMYLKGEAFFDVAKDSLNPFVVYSDELSTMAVGTSFTVKNFEKENFIQVHLHTGKVAVSAADSGKDSLADDLFLSPGESLSYDKRKKIAHISRSEKSGNGLAANKGISGGFATVDWYMINNQPLDQVFEQLEQLYGISISYSKEDINTMYFIGKFEKTDSLETVLHDITFLNNLSVKKTGHNKYRITKAH